MFLRRGNELIKSDLPFTERQEDGFVSIAFEGYKIGDRLVIKELCFVDINRIMNFFFGTPDDILLRPSEFKFLIKGKGIPIYHDGEEFNPNIIEKYYNTQKCLFHSRGEENCNELSKIFKIKVKNLECIGCPKIMINTPCNVHDESVYHCAVKRAHGFQFYIETLIGDYGDKVLNQYKKVSFKS